MEEMTTLSQVLNKLREKGITKEIKMNEDKQIVCEECETVDPENLTIIQTYRFEGASDPSDNAVLYLTKSTNGDLAYILDAYGAYSGYEGKEFDDFIKTIPVEEEEGYEL